MDSRRLRRFDAFAHRVLRSGLLGLKRASSVFRKTPDDIPSSPGRILAVRLWGLAPLLAATPALFALRQRFSSSEFTLLTCRGLESLYRDGELSDQTLAWEAKRLAELPRAIRRFSRQVQTAPLDVAIHFGLQSELGTLLTHASGGKCTVGLVRRDEGRRGYTHPLRVDVASDATTMFFAISHALGATGEGSPPLAPQLTSSEIHQAIEVFRNWGLDGHTRLVGICLNADEDPTQRTWPPQKFILLAQMLEELGGYKTVFFSTPEEEVFVNRHVKQMATRPVNLSGRTSLRQFAALTSRLHLLISGSPGPMLLARSLGIPTLSVLHRHDIGLYAASDDERHAVIACPSIPGHELPLDGVRGQLMDLLDHLADPDDPPWLAA